MKRLPHNAAVVNDTQQLIEDNYKLNEILRHLHTIQYDSVNDWPTGGMADKIAVEGLFIGTIQQVKHWHRITQKKLKWLYAK